MKTAVLRKPDQEPKEKRREASQSGSGGSSAAGGLPLFLRRTAVGSAHDAATAPAQRASIPTPLPNFLARTPPTLRVNGGAPLGPSRRITPIGHLPSLPAGPGQPPLTLNGPGEPLPQAVRERLESGFGADLGLVRVHVGDAAARLALGHGARAFAYGHHIVLSRGASAYDLGLMAHEIAHVLQQQGAPAVQRCGTGNCTCGGACGGSSYENEAVRASHGVSAGGTFVVTGQTSTTLPQHAPEEEGWVESKIWGLLEEYAPNLVPIVRRGPEGVLDWIKDKVTGAIESVVDTVMAPVRSIAATGKWLQEHFAPLLAWMQDAAAKIAQNDCKPISEAAQKIEDVAAEVITPVVEKLQEVTGKVGDFFKGVWDKFGVPVWEFIKKYAGQQWEQLQQLGQWIWAKTEPVRALAESAWTWLKNKLGIGEGPEGQNGILQWIQGKAEVAWDWVQAKLEPYKKQITAVAATVGAIAVMVSPAGPVVLAGAAIVGVVQGVRWIRANLGGGDAIVRARTYAQTVVIPQIMGAIGKMTGAITHMAGFVSGKLGEFSAALGRVVGAAASTALNFLVDAAQWLADRAMELAAWATEKLTALADWIQKGLERLRVFLQPITDFLGKVGSLLSDIFGLPLLLAGALWNKIPKCIRDPFVDWIVPLILRQIDIFKELVKDNEAWQKTKADVMNIIRLVFVTKDLLGAIRATFHLILRVFNVPVELLAKVAEKASVAWDIVIAAPIKFLKNCVRTVGRGLQIYWSHLKANLLSGLEGWLFGELAGKGISKPKSWSDPWDLMQLALDVMGLSVNHVFDLMEKRFEKATVDKLRVWYGRLARVWDWITEMRGKKPAEVTKEIIAAAVGFGKTIFEGIVTWIVERVATELATMAAAAAASAGLSEVLDAIRRIYRAIKTAVRWMRTILEMVNNTLDSVMNIAAGVIEPAAVILEGALKGATPAVIGFLGDQVGLGGVAEKIREIIDKLRAKVDGAILAIIDKLRAFFGAIAQGAGQGGGESKLRPIIFSVGQEKHRLWVETDGGHFVAMLSSKPTTVAGFASALQVRIQNLPSADPKRGPLLTAIAQVQASLSKLIPQLAGAPGLQTPGSGVADEYERLANRLQNLIILESAGVHTGSASDPIPLTWYKPFGAYGSIVLTINGRQRNLLPGRENWIPAPERGGFGGWVVTGEINLGVDSEFRPQQSKPLRRLGAGESTRARVTKEVELFTRLIQFYSVSGSGFQIDHVQDLGLGGFDVKENLWPLAAAKNNAGNEVYRQLVWVMDMGGPRVDTVENLTGKNFVIQRIA
jgi:hypothetical protein